LSFVSILYKGVNPHQPPAQTENPVIWGFYKTNGVHRGPPMQESYVS